MRNAFKHLNLGLIPIVLLSVILNVYNLTRDALGNTYYAAAVKSMLQSWHNFFFVSFDPAGFISIDKPPVAFWIQTAAAKIFGFQGLSLLLPQAIAGVLSVIVIYYLVARVYGKNAGLLSALIMAVTPVAVAISRSNNVDSLLVFVLLLATYALLRAIEKGNLAWLLLAAGLIGVGFNVKMLEAYMVLPAFFVGYLLAPRLSWRKKLQHLGLATVMLIVISLSWATAVDLVPASARPYVGSSKTNSVLELAVGYNGISRLTGMHFGSDGKGGGAFPGFSGSGATGFHGGARTGDFTPPGGIRSGSWAGSSGGSRPGLTDWEAILKGRLGGLAGRGRELGGQAFSAAGMFDTGPAGLLRLFQPSLAGQISWLLVLAMFGLVSLLTGIRRHQPLDQGQRTTVFWGAWLLPMAAFFSVSGFFHSYYMVTMAPGIAALAGAGLVKMWDDLRQGRGWRSWLLPVAVAGNAAVEVYILATNVSLIGWGWPIAVGVLTLLGVSGLLLLRGRRQQSWGVGVAGIWAVALTAMLVAPLYWSATPALYGGGNSTMPAAGPDLKNSGRPMDRTSTGGNTKLIQYLEAHERGETYLYATDSAMTAAPVILATGKAVMAFGGFLGSDPALTVPELSRLAAAGKVHYFLISPRSSSQQDIVNWITQHSKVVPATLWQSGSQGFGPGAMGNTQLYEYQPA